MTPLTQARLASFSSPACNPTQLAAQPLEFTSERECTTPKVAAAIMDALADKRSSDQLIAAICKNAYLHSYLDELNSLINRVDAQHGTGTVVIGNKVLQLLADEQIILTRNPDDTLRVVREVVVHPDYERQDMVSTVLTPMLPKVLCQLVSQYEADFEIEDSNEYELCAIIAFGDPVAKSMLFAAACRQHKLNAFCEIINRYTEIDLSHVDLSNLDLSGSELSFCDLSFSNLSNSNLQHSWLLDTNLTNANLNCADLSYAHLTGANLTAARLIKANLFRANITRTNLNGTCLLGASMRKVEMGHFPIFRRAVYNFSDITVEMSESEQRKYERSSYYPVRINAPINVIILPQLSDHTPTFTARNSSRYVDISSNGTKTVVIDESEKNLLLGMGIQLVNNGKGAFQLRRNWSVVHDPSRKQCIEATLAPLFPKELSDIVSAYDDEIEFEKLNRPRI